MASEFTLGHALRQLRRSPGHALSPGLADLVWPETVDNQCVKSGPSLPEGTPRMPVTVGELKPGIIVRGPVFPEPIEVLVVTPLGDVSRSSVRARRPDRSTSVS